MNAPVTSTQLVNAGLDCDHIAEVSNSQAATAIDRLGSTKRTVKGAVDSLAAFNIRGAFAGATAYVVKDVYTDSGLAYVTLIAHTSTSVAADLAAGKVTIHQGVTFADLAAPGGSDLVGYGLRTLTDIMEVYVEKYGAVGDGVTDDTAAFQSALDSAAYVHVKMLAKNYFIAGTLTVTTQATLTGPDGGSQEMQAALIIHDTGSTGELFNVTAGVAGVCLKNFRVTGGNGSFCIVSSNSYVNYEHILFRDYDGGGIQLLTSGDGSSSSRISKCEWVSVNSPNNYTGFEINVAGGDIHLDACTAIRGAIGINIIQGQTIVVDKCSLNKQTRYTGVAHYSTATQFNTAGIKLSGTTYKQAISIKNSYIETCDNGIYVDACASLTIEDNHINDVGIAGNVGAWSAVGNSAINLVDANAKNVTIRNNFLKSSSGATLANPFYVLRFNAAENVIYENNYMDKANNYIAEYYLTTGTIYKIANKVIHSAGVSSAAYDPSNLMRTLAYEINGTFTPTLKSTGATFSYTNQTGYYKKVGDLVWIAVNIALATSGNTLTANAIVIEGLPFTTSADVYQRSVVNAIFSNPASANSMFASGILPPSSDDIQLYDPSDSSTSRTTLLSNFFSPTAGAQIWLSGWYMAAS